MKNIGKVPNGINTIQFQENFSLTMVADLQIAIFNLFCGLMSNGHSA